MTIIYKICPAGQWHAAAQTGSFRGMAVDLRDGFIHFSTAGQVAETAARHFAGEGDLLLIAVDAERLGDALRWEVSRGGASFPHLYGDLPVSAVAWVKPLPLNGAGAHVFPEPLP